MHALLQSIENLRRRIVWRRRFTAGGWIVAATLAAALVLGLADYVWQFRDIGVRIMATAAFVALVSWVAYRIWYLPSSRLLRLLDVARRVESRFPQLQDSLASAVEFLEQSTDDDLAGSPQLRRLVVAQAQVDAAELPLDVVVDRRPLRRATMALILTSLAALACCIIDASAVRIAIARMAAPLGSTHWPRQHHLALRNVPKRLAAGDTLEVEVVDLAGPIPGDVRFEFGVARDGGRIVTNEPLVRRGEALVARKENVRQSFGIRAEGGDDDTMPWTWIEVVDAPRLKSFNLKVHPPAYTGLPAVTIGPQLDVLAGSRIEASGITERAIRAARIVPAGAAPIVATVTADHSGAARRAFHISPQQWIAAKSGTYQLELDDDDNLTGVVGQWQLNVEPDPPPSLSWQQPTTDLFVLPQAVVPLAVRVADNLAIRSVKLAYSTSDASHVAPAMADSAVADVELYRGPEQPTVTGEPSSPAPENRLVKHAWDLASLDLRAGARLTVDAVAEDFRPSVGRTANSFRIAIITPDELEARLAEQQTRIVRLLEEALAAQRATRDDVRRLEVETREIGSLTPAGRATLQSAELNQRRVARMLVDSDGGARMLVQAVLDEITMNRLANSPLLPVFTNVAAELHRLADLPLDAADRELTAVRKAIDIVCAGNAGGDAAAAQVFLDQEALGRVTRSLSLASAAEEDVIAALERLADALAGEVNYQRLIRMIAEICRDQVAHEQTARAQIGLETVPLELNELTRQQRELLNQAAVGQDVLAKRFAATEQRLNNLAQQPTASGSLETAVLTDAAALAQELEITREMRQTAGDLHDNRVGQALEREQRIAAHLQRLLAVLRREADQQPRAQAAELRAAERELSALQQRTARLQEQLVSTDANPTTRSPDRQAELVAEQQAIRREADRMSRELERMRAAEAAQSTANAARQLDATAPERPSSASQAQRARESLEHAQQQLADHRRQFEEDLALEFVRRFQSELSEMVERQRQLLEQTREFDANRPPDVALLDDQRARVVDWAHQERQLAQQAKEHSELLFGLAAVRVSLADAEQRLLAVAKLLAAAQTGSHTQLAERHALDRLEAMLQAFSQTANQAAKPPDTPSPPSAAPNAEPRPRRPTFELLQAKMLRMLQADLNRRTQQLHERLSQANSTAVPQQEAQDLAAEQHRLAELAEAMLKSNNEKELEQ